MFIKNVHARKLLALITFVLFSAPAYAEVMDKLPSIYGVYFAGVVGTLFCFISSRRNPRFLIVFVPVLLIYFSALLIEINDPFVGKAIVKEAGYFYVISSYILCLSILAGVVIGFWLRKNAKT